MFYKKLDLDKMYEAYNQTAINEQAEASNNMTPKAAEDSEATTNQPNEKVTIAKGNTYALPIDEELERNLHALADQGSGEWRSSEPLQPLLYNKGQEAAMMKVGGKDLPVYLLIRLVKDKDDQRSTPLNLIEADRCYVALMITPEGLSETLDNLGDISSPTKLFVDTPVIQKGGNVVEHSIQLWEKNPTVDDEEYEDQVEEPTIEDIPDTVAEDPAMDDATNVEMEGSNIKVNMEDAMSAPGTAAGFESNESKAPTFAEYLKRNS